VVRLIQDNFYLIQIIFGGIVLVLAWSLLKPKTPESNFKVREADLRSKNKTTTASNNDLANSKMKQPLRLGGISIAGAPHEILGVPINASTDQINKAYRELMKQYHPDKIGSPGNQQWNDSQKIAEAINRAKNEMLSKRK